MRICLLSKEYPPDTGWGGIGAYTFQIAQGLKEIGHDVEVVSLLGRDAPGSSDAGNNPPQAVMESGIPVHRAAWRGTLDRLGMVKRLTPFTHYNLETNFALWSKFAAVHSLCPFDVIEAAEHLADGLMPAISRSLPMVIKLHTPQSKLIAERFHELSTSLDQHMVAMSERAAMVSAEVLMSPSEDLADWVANDLRYPRDDIRIVRNPVDANKFSPEGSKAIASDDRLTVLFTGRLEERKGIHYLIRAIPTIVSRFPNVRFVALGADTNTAAGQNSVLAELRGMLVNSGYSEHVTFISQVPLDEVPAYYRSADICVAPSLYDNAPYTCIEAMSCGRAFVGTSAGGMREYLVEGESGLIVPPADQSALAEAILSLLQDDQLRTSMGNKARQRALEKFHRTAIAAENVDLYNLAQQRFQIRKQGALYRGSNADLTSDVSGFLEQYDRALYDLMYVNSWSFKLRHRWNRVISKLKALFTTSTTDSAASAQVNRNSVVQTLGDSG